MSADRAIMQVRHDAAEAMQRLVFRAQQQQGFVRIEDCMEVTDMITVSVIAAVTQYMQLCKEQDNEYAN